MVDEAVLWIRKREGKKMKKMKLKKIILAVGTYLIVSSIPLKAQTQDTLLFLGDTLHFSKTEVRNLKPADTQYLKAIPNMDNQFIVYKCGNFIFQGKNYTIADPLEDGVTKILVLGNSFSDDGLEYYFHDLANEAGKPLVIGNLFRGGAPLDFHLKNALENISIYDYRKTSIDGTKTNTRKTSILTALEDENWDYICFQQASVLSGDLASIREYLPPLYKYVQDHYPISSVKYLFHQTWAYAQNATTKNFEKYDNDQLKMYNKIVSASQAVAQIVPIHTIIPDGTAIQNARSSFIGDNLTREGYHLDLQIGRFVAACTWYEALFGGVKKLSFKPFALNETKSGLAKEAAYLAVKFPFQASTLSEYQKQSLSKRSFSTIQINFGSGSIMPGWNSFLFERALTKMSALIDNHNKPTDVNISLLRSFDVRESKGPNRTATKMDLPGDVSKYYFSAQIEGSQTRIPFILIENLDPKKIYNIDIFSGKGQEGPEVGIGLEGLSPGKVQWIKTGYNNSHKLSFKNITPDNICINRRKTVPKTAPAYRLFLI